MRRRHLLLLPALAALAALLGAPAPRARAGDPEYERKLRSVAPGDHEALFELALWCLGMDEDLKRRGRDHLEDIAVAAGGDLRAKALYRLGLFHYTQGRTYYDRKRGARFLRLSADRGHEAARRRITEIEAETLAKKRELLEKADRHLADRRLDLAVRALTDAYRLPLGEGSLSDRAVRGRLAFAYAEMGKELRRLDASDVNASCQTCGGSGFMPCRKCEGKGKIKVKKGPELVTGIEGSSYKKGEEVEVKCPRCKGTGGEPCRDCRGLGLNFDILPGESHDALRSMAGTLKRLVRRRDPWNVVRLAWERVVETRLHVPAGFRVEDVGGTKRYVPPDVTLVDRPALEKFWEEASDRDKHRYLLGFVCLAAQYLRPIFMHDSAPNTLGDRAPLDARLRTMPVDVDVVAALPEVFHDRWVAVRGRVEKKRRRGGTEWDDDSFEWFFLHGPNRTPLRCFHWTQREGREKHTLLAKLDIGKGFRHLDRFVWSYRYQDVQEAMEDLGRDDEVVLFGRFLHDPMAVDAALLEIWHVDRVCERGGRTTEWLPGAVGRTPPADASAAHRAGHHAVEGWKLLRNEVFNKSRRRKKGEEADALERERDEQRRKALACFRSARDILEKAAARRDKDDTHADEMLGQVNRDIDEVLRAIGR